ncbi:MAG: LCP family protein [Lachnospiraceae bacterium]|nr:LCP family protein [Lachnospiraceae bacterium]
MADDPGLDEMIEILPDESSLDTNGTDQDDKDDMIIRPDKEDSLACPQDDDEDADMTIVPERVSIDEFNAAGQEEIADDEDADMTIVPERISIGEFNVDSTEQKEVEVDEDADMKVVTDDDTYEDDYSREIYELEHEDDDRDLIEEIEASIQEQNINSMDDSVSLSGLEIEKEMLSGPARFMAALKKIPAWAYIIMGISFFVIVGVIVVFAMGVGEKIVITESSEYAAGKMNYSPVVEEPVIEIPDDLDYDMKPGIEVVDESQELEMPEVKKKPVTTEPVQEEEKKVHNILLLGEENLDGSDGRGRSDLIMIATINEEDRSIKLTSIMRDILVAIPGQNDNRLNAAYAMGGVSLVYQTLANNLGIDIDNYARVNFDSFESIIDAIGGVDIELTEEEASYLNRTNYISKEEYRNVKAGMNHLNGNQALGYCRIRKVGTSGREYSDFGRTSRHRMLLESVVASMKDMSIKQLKKFCDKCLPFVTTDIDEETLQKYIKAVFEIGLDKKVRDYRIPVDGTYSDANLRGMLVTKVDLRKNAIELHEFIYGK